MDFSKYQNDIFSALGSGSLAVSAVPGSGKTTTIVEAAKHVDGDAAFLAFGRDIADELGDRLPDHVPASTIHSLGMSACRNNIEDLSVEKNKYWQIADDLLASNRHARNLFTSPWPLVQLCNHARSSRAKLSWASMMNLAEKQGILGFRAYGELGWGEIAGVVKTCVQIGTRQALNEGVIDFTDMVWLPLFKRWHIAEFDYLFIDEAQDLNRMQLDFAEQCLAPDGQVVAVGDPNQAIFAFAGAMSDSFFNVRERFQARELPLSICYRCPEIHLVVAREYVAHIEGTQKAGTIDSISRSSLPFELSRLAPDDSALILCRKKAPLVEQCIELLLADVPCSIRGGDVVEGLIKLLRTLERSYKAEYSNLFSKLDVYRERRVNDLTGAYGTRATRLISEIDDEVNSLVTLVHGFPEIKSISGLTRKLKSLSRGSSRITLSTIHKAKGLEAEWVGILDIEDMPLSHPHQTEEETRQENNLILIALTRSTRDLRFVA